MKHLLREYGFLTILVLAGIGGYFLYQSQATDLVEVSLDSIDLHLQEMVDSPQNQAYASDLVDSFREKVRSGKVSPGELEQVEANILNLSRSGSSLTPEEASVLFQIAAVNPDSVAVFLGIVHGHSPSVVPAPPEPLGDVGRKMVVNLPVLTQLRSLRAKGYAPPARIDSLLNALESDIDQMVKTALDSAGANLKLETSQGD